MVRTPQLGGPELTPQAQRLATFNPPEADAAMFGGGVRDYVGPAVNQGLTSIGAALGSAMQAYEQEQRSLQNFNTQTAFIEFESQEQQRLMTDVQSNMPKDGNGFTQKFIAGNPDDEKNDAFNVRSQKWLETHAADDERMAARYGAKMAELKSHLSTKALAAEMLTRERHYNTTIKNSMETAKSTFADNPTPENFALRNREIEEQIDASGLTPEAKDEYKRQWARDSELAYNMARETMQPGSVVDGHAPRKPPSPAAQAGQRISRDFISKAEEIGSVKIDSYQGNCGKGVRGCAGALFGSDYFRQGLASSGDANAASLSKDNEYFQKSGLYKPPQPLDEAKVQDKAFLEALPVGSVISAGGGNGNGHVQIKVAQDQWVSDAEQGDKILLARANGAQPYKDFVLHAPTPEALERVRMPVDQTPSPRAPAATPQSGGTSADVMTRAKAAIATIESGSIRGNYQTIGPVTRNGDRAYGKYQVMGANIPAWTRRWVGQEMSADSFLRNPEAQERVFEGQFGELLKRYSPSDAASVWFTGQPQSAAAARGANDGSTSVNTYVSKFNRVFGGDGWSSMPATAGRTSHLTLRADAPTAHLTFEDKMRLLDFAERNYNKSIADQNAADTAAYAQSISGIQKAAHDGKFGYADLEAEWGKGTFKDFNDYARVEQIISSREKKADDAMLFNERVSRGDTNWNPFSTTDKKQVDAGLMAQGGTPEAGFAIYQKTGLLPSATAQFMRGALISQDPKRVEAAAMIAGNMLTRNPNALAGIDGGADIEKAGVAFNHYVNDLGFSSTDAAKRIAQQNDPEWRQKHIVRDDELKAFKDDIRKNVNASAVIGSAFDQSFLGLGRNADVNAIPAQAREEMLHTFEELATDYFQNQAADKEAAKAYAISGLKQLYGVSNGYFTKYPPENRYPPDAEGQHGYIYRQAAADIAAETGAKIPATDVYLTPIPRVTAEDFKAGKPPRYMIMYKEMINDIPIWKPILGKAFAADPDAANREVSAKRKAAFDAGHARARGAAPSAGQPDDPSVLWAP